MKFTCLSKGGGFQFPPCHILDVFGCRILIECPLDLSALTIFSPVPTDFYTHEEASNDPSHEVLDKESVAQKRQKIEKPLDANNLIFAEPWYKTVSHLHLWNASFIDVILVSSPMGMLGLPYLTQIKDFSAKVYVTEAAARLGHLMMQDLVSMHMEYKQFYGSQESSVSQWMNWEELNLLPSELRNIAIGKDGAELGGWMPPYSAAHVKDCMSKVQTLRYAEEACYNGTLVIKAFSSGLEIGACNWVINGPQNNLAFMSGSISVSGHAMNFDCQALEGSNQMIYSDLSSLDAADNIEPSIFSDDNKNWEESTKSADGDESSEEMEKLAFICSCAIDSVKAGGSVLIPINRFGVFLQLLEQILLFLESLSLKVPIYIISSVAEELLAYTNVIPEWLCNQRQERLFRGESLFDHVEHVKENKICVFPAIHSPKLLKNWQEPCIVFSTHWSLRLGPAVHLLRRWCGDPNSLLILENEVDANIALLPFKPMAMKVLQCSFLSGIRLQKVQPLLKKLQPKSVLLPEELSKHINSSNSKSFSISYYSENETLCIPSLKETCELDIAVDLASKFDWRTLKQENHITRLKGELSVYHGKHRLCPGNDHTRSTPDRLLLHWGSPDPENLLATLSKMGIHGFVERNMADADAESGKAFIIHVQDPNKALIEVRATGTVISAADEVLASHIFEAIGSVLDGI